MPPVHYHHGKFPPDKLAWDRIVPWIEPATLALGEFKGLLDAIPNPTILLAPLSAQEAVLSSRIEGTQATLGEVLEYEAGGERPESEDKLNDIREVLNYRRAIARATELLQELPLCGRLLKEAHAILMDDVRGRNKDAGNYKKTPNAIGPPGCNLDTAKFIPIEPEKLEAGMRIWENYIHSDQPNTLVQLGLAHAEFESLHPFLDGNGRLGRMILPLFLYERKMLNFPALYLSEYFEAHKDEYTERLLAVSRDDDWTGWSVFFLNALQQQARENTRKARAIMELYERRKAWIQEKAHSQYGVAIVDFLFSQPIFKATDLGAPQNVPAPTARRILGVIRDELLLQIRPSSGRRPAIFAYKELLDIAEGREGGS
ncbi:MAG: Fic family protein [Opitutales bacterium]